MKNTFPYQLITLFFIIFMVCFTLAFYALGWTEPTADPPAGNIDVPVNIGAISQVKTGAFSVEGIFQADGGSGDDVLTVTFVAGEGRVGIGTENPTEELHVVGEIRAVNGGVCQTIGGVTNCLGSSQKRVLQSCAAGSSIRLINTDGTVDCEIDDGGAGGVTSISAGSGITLSPNPITSTGTINVNTGSVAATGLETSGSLLRLMTTGSSAGQALKRNSTNDGWVYGVVEDNTVAACEQKGDCRNSGGAFGGGGSGRLIYYSGQTGSLCVVTSDTGSCSTTGCDGCFPSYTASCCVFGATAVNTIAVCKNKGDCRGSVGGRLIYYSGQTGSRCTVTADIGSCFELGCSSCFPSYTSSCCIFEQ